MSPRAVPCIRAGLLAALALTLLAICGPVAAQSRAPLSKEQAAPPPNILRDPDLDAGFNLLYNLQFVQARDHFLGWESLHPAEPLGPALEAAAYLYEEFYRKGVMTSNFFLDNNRLLGGIAGKPDPDLEMQFTAAAERAEQEARQRLVTAPRDPGALLALTLTAGMRANNAFLIEKRTLESLRQLRETENDARALLEVAPQAGDAYMALGASNYILGCLPVYERAFLRLGGVRGDKVLGMQQLTTASSIGHYLRPYAKLMLALAALRERQPALARQQFADLAAEFPANPLFARELSKISVE